MAHDPEEADEGATGALVRAARLDRGLKQMDLARAAGISPSYLNLIEHGRRPIGGALLRRLAGALGTEPSSLVATAGLSLTTALAAAAAARPGTGAETESPDALARRFPGHARLIEALLRDRQTLEREVEALGDRLTHDPQLSATLHDLLTHVTAIRSTGDILGQGADLDEGWRQRFLRNIGEDSKRLAEAAGGLVRFLDAGQGDSRMRALPQEELEAWLSARNWRVEELEADPDAELDPVAAGLSPGAAGYARVFLDRYAADARALPLERLAAATAADPLALAAGLGLPPALVLRRLGLVADGDTGALPGLVICDASGTLVFRRPIEGFPLPRFGSACPLWPLFEALRQPGTPVSTRVAMAGAGDAVFACDAVADLDWPEGYDAPATVEAVMLIRPRDAAAEPAARVVGSSCRVCARRRCPARREPSILATAA